MDSKPSIDYLTSSAQGVAFHSKHGTHFAFAILTSPATFGTPLFEELKSKGKSHEYMLIRNTAILRRMCLKYDTVNPVVEDRLTFLRPLYKRMKELQTETSTTRIARGFVQLFRQYSDKYHAKLSKALLEIDDSKEYIDMHGKRLNYLTAFNTTDSDSHHLLSTYISSLKAIGAMLNECSPAWRIFLLSSGFYSYLINLTDDDNETRFKVTLTHFERAIISSTLLSTGSNADIPTLSYEEEDAIRQLWPSAITISRRDGEDYFGPELTGDLDQLKIIHTDSTPYRIDSGSELSERATALYDMLIIDSPKTPTSSTSAKFPQKSVSELSTNIANGLKVLDELKQSEKSVNTHIGHSVTTETDFSRQTYVPPHSRGEADTSTPGSELRWKRVASRILFESPTCGFRVIRARPTESPDRQIPGEVVHVALHHTPELGEVVSNFWFKRFEIRPDGSYDLYLTKSGQFHRLLNLRDKAVKIEVRVNTRSLKESKEIIKETSSLWFVTE